jgi:hypothetical protein
MYHERIRDQDIGPPDDPCAADLQRYKLELQIKDEQRLREQHKKPPPMKPMFESAKTMQVPKAQSNIVERRMTQQPAVKLMDKKPRPNETFTKLVHGRNSSLMDNTEIELADQSADIEVPHYIDLIAESVIKA